MNSHTHLQVTRLPQAQCHLLLQCVSISPLTVQKAPSCLILALVVKVTSSKSPTEQNLLARQSDISVLQTQVQSLMDIFSKTRIVVDKCRQDMNGFETRLSDICFVVQEQWRKKGKIMLLHQILQPETLALRSNDLCSYTSNGGFIYKDCKLYANMPFVVWLEFILL